jgi:RNA methyltransferase, TrmH family
MLTARETKELRFLKSGRRRDAGSRFLAEGVRVVEDLLASGLHVHYLVAASSIEDTPQGDRLLLEAERLGISVRIVTEGKFHDLAATDAPQGVLAVAETPLTGIADLPLGRESSIVLVLDGIQDPGNLGTLVRSAEAFDAAGVVAVEGTVDPWNPKSVRAAAGSSFRIPIARTSWESTVKILRERGFRIVGASMEGEPVGALGQYGRTALVVGNEGSGLSSEVRSGVDRLIGIPTPGRAESLNVAAAAAILLYELSGTRHRSPAG